MEMEVIRRAREYYKAKHKEYVLGSNYSEEDIVQLADFAASEVARSWEWVKYDPEHPPEDGLYACVARGKVPNLWHFWSGSKEEWDLYVVAYIPHKLPEVE